MKRRKKTTIGLTVPSVTKAPLNIHGTRNYTVTVPGWSHLVVCNADNVITGGSQLLLPWLQQPFERLIKAHRSKYGTAVKVHPHIPFPKFLAKKRKKKNNISINTPKRRKKKGRH